MKNKNTELRRQLYKKLKERKLFSKYCTNMAYTFSNNDYGFRYHNPHTRYEEYLNFWSVCNLPSYLQMVEGWIPTKRALIQY